MSTEKTDTLHIDHDLQVRLLAIAERTGHSVPELAETVLRSYADDAEREQAEFAEDEERWQRYLESGSAIAFDTVKGKLHRLASEAARRADPQ